MSTLKDTAIYRATKALSRCKTLSAHLGQAWITGLFADYEESTLQTKCHPLASWLANRRGRMALDFELAARCLLSKGAISPAKLAQLKAETPSNFENYVHEMIHAGRICLSGYPVGFISTASVKTNDFSAHLGGQDVAFEVASFDLNIQATKNLNAEIAQQKIELKKKLKKSPQPGAYSIMAVHHNFNDHCGAVEKIRTLKPSKQVAGKLYSVLMLDLRRFWWARREDFQKRYRTRHGVFSGIFWNAFYGKAGGPFLTGLYGRHIYPEKDGSEVRGCKVKSDGKFINPQTRFNAALFYWKGGDMDKDAIYVFYQNPVKPLPGRIAAAIMNTFHPIRKLSRLK